MTSIEKTHNFENNSLFLNWEELQLANSNLLSVQKWKDNLLFTVKYWAEIFMLKILNSWEILFSPNWEFMKQDFIKIKWKEIIIDKVKVKNPKLIELKEEIHNNNNNNNNNKDFVSDWEIAEIESRWNIYIDNILENFDKIKVIEEKLKLLHPASDEYINYEKKLEKFIHENQLFKINTSADTESINYFLDIQKEKVPLIDETIRLSIVNAWWDKLAKLIELEDWIDLNKRERYKIISKINNLNIDEKKLIFWAIKDIMKYWDQSMIFNFQDFNWRRNLSYILNWIK